MSYIKSYERIKFNAILNELEEALPADADELHYLLTVICKVYLNRSKVRSISHTDVHGTLSRVSQEIYRRETAPFEDKRIKENGDVQVE
jgi:hypothetical protein